MLYMEIKSNTIHKNVEKCRYSQCFKFKSFKTAFIVKHHLQSLNKAYMKITQIGTNSYL